MERLETLIQIRKLLHDMAQPLAVAVGLADLLALQLDEASPHFQELQTISRQLEKVLGFTGEIRRLAREASPPWERPPNLRPSQDV